MSAPFTAGDVVRHQRRPEWGFGTVQRVEVLRRGSGNDQRLWIRFANAGLKTLLASASELETVRSADGTLVAGDDTLVARELRGETGWLGEISKRKPEDAMAALPAEASNPFLSASRRLEFVLSLYRFEPQTRLIDWAVAQSGLGDPLSRFSRHELEQFFQLWAFERDAALQRLLADQEFRGRPEVVQRIAAKAAPAAQAAIRRIQSFR
jgi:hypothetical protein